MDLGSLWRVTYCKFVILGCSKSLEHPPPTFFFFWSCLQYVEVPGPGMEPIPQQ